MDLDHVRGKKFLCIASMMQYTEKRLREEMAKCEVRCAVCHRLRTHGIAPVLMEQAPVFETG